jgi:hypothetical protein
MTGHIGVILVHSKAGASAREEKVKVTTYLLQNAITGIIIVYLLFGIRMEHK